MYESPHAAKSAPVRGLPAVTLTVAGVCVPTLRQTVARKTKEEALATRELLLDTAEAIFLQRGVARTSLNDIASAAGLTRGAVYWHFADKTALYHALMDRLSERFCTIHTLSDAEREADPMAALRRIALLPIDLVREDPRAYRLFTISRHRVEFSEDLALIWQRHMTKGSEYVEQLAQLFSAARRRQRIGADAGLPPAQAALGLFALVDGLITYATMDPQHCASLNGAAALIDAYLTGTGCRLPPDAA